MNTGGDTPDELSMQLKPPPEKSLQSSPEIIGDRLETETTPAVHCARQQA